MKAPSNNASEIARHLTKRALADVLNVSARTIQNYVESGALPPSIRQGRNAVWTLDSLAEVVLSKSSSLSTPLRFLLQGHLDSLVETGAGCGPARTAGRGISTGYLLDDFAVIDIDWRPRIHELNAEHRAAAKAHHCEAFDHHRSSDEHKQLLQFAARNRDAVELNEARLAAEFLPPHGATQLLGARNMLTNALFTVANPRCARSTSRSLTFKLQDGTAMQYEGPEMRQDDGLVFSALIRVACDARPGRLVGFSAKELCLSLFADYSGPRRRQLKATIERLQSAKLKFREFAVQLVGRFEFPKRGLWAVALDRDVIRLFADGRQVWLRLDKALEYGNGTAGWLYRYVCSQTTLIPTKVERLRTLAGSSATIESFRRDLKTALAHLASAGDIQAGWSIRQDMVHWLKPFKRSIERLTAVALNS